MIDAANPNQRAEQMTAMARRIAVLVDTEIEALKANRMKGADANMQEKERLVHSWRLEVERIRDHPSLLSGADQALKDDLAQISVELADKLEDLSPRLVDLRLRSRDFR